jgi:hypothetical protein
MPETTVIELADLRVGNLVKDAQKDYEVERLSLLPSGSICATLVPMVSLTLPPSVQEASRKTVIGAPEMPITVYK